MWYPSGTALVELARINFDASRFGFLTASWHNLFEYGILLFNFYDFEKAKKVRLPTNTLLVRLALPLLKFLSSFFHPLDSFWVLLQNSLRSVPVLFISSRNQVKES